MENIIERENKEILYDEKALLARVKSELEDGLNVMRKYYKSVTILGSSRALDSDKWKKDAENLARMIVKDLGYAVVTGGGPGIMEAANRGATDAGGDSLGITIRLPHEQKTNKYISREVYCTHFFTRKTILTFASEAWVFFPGGFGTFDELFSVLVLLQNKKIPQIPVILIGSEYWNEIFGFMKKFIFAQYGYIEERDLSLFKIEDDLNKVIEIIKSAPINKWWKNYEMADK